MIPRLVLAVLASSALPVAAGAQQSDSAAVASVIERFHAALAAGDSTAALALLAPDVTVLESGGLETLEEYRSHESSSSSESLPPREGPPQMTSVWLPMDDWTEHLALDQSIEVTVWRSGLPVPPDVSLVEFYVPEYLGPSSVHDVIAQMTSVQVVQTLTAGYESVLPHLASPKTRLCNARGVHDASTAELAVGLVLASLRGIPEFVHAQGRGVWSHERRPALADKQVLVLGAGAVGAAVVARLAPFETDVVSVASTERAGVRAVADLPSLLPEADVVIVTVPLTASTRRLVDKGFLDQMKTDALLVNVSRGQVVDTDALVEVLRTGRISAALDVTDPEPLPASHPLWRLPNVLVSPHVGGDTSAFLPRAWRLLQSQLDRFVSGEPLLNVVR
jgi:phosphoglycerate dehydrogenase-like enzyme